MSDKDINQMDFKELRNEVQMLRDELAIMQRKYEDLFYNLDNENFSSSIIKEKEKMKAEIKITAEEISTKVSSSEVESMISQTAGEINSEISSVKGSLSSVRQSVNGLSSRVSDAEGVTSVFEQTAYGFTLDGERVTFTGVIYLTDNEGNKAVSFFHDESQGHPQVFIESYEEDTPFIIGKAGKVYIGNTDTGSKVATQGWVENNCTAKFG